MAARGYWQSFKLVKASIDKILSGNNAGDILDDEHGNWYIPLFSPSITVGILKPSHLAGYRNKQGFIGQSKHTPMNVDAVRDTMPLLFDLLKNEEHPGVRAVLEHFIFVYIHPYGNGNERIARFLMNAMQASGCYPWMVIPLEERKTYMPALEKASVELDIIPFTEFLAWLVKAIMDEKPIAKLK